MGALATRRDDSLPCQGSPVAVCRLAAGRAGEAKDCRTC